MMHKIRHRIHSSAALQKMHIKHVGGYERSQSKVAVFSAVLAATAAIVAAALAAWIAVDHDNNKDAARSAYQIVEALIDIEACAVRYVRAPHKWGERDALSNQQLSSPSEPRTQTEICDMAPLKKALAGVDNLPIARYPQIIPRLCTDVHQEIRNIASSHLISIRPRESHLHDIKKLAEAFRSAEFVMANAQLAYQAFLSAVRLLGERCDGAPLSIVTKEFDELRSVYAERRAALLPSLSEDDIRGSLISGYGYRANPFTGELLRHTGNDFAAELGTPVFAVETGRVRVYRDSNYGITVSIAMSGEETVLYAHLSKAYVKDGSLVKIGDKIGAVGTTGRSTGPHLHIEKRVRDIPIDPSGYTAKQIFRLHENR